MLKDMAEWKMMFGINTMFRYIVESREEGAVRELVSELRPFLDAGPLNVTYAVPAGLPDKNSLRYMEKMWRSSVDQGSLFK